MSEALSLAGGSDVEAAAERLARTGRTRLCGLLGEGAARLHAVLDDPERDWARAIRNPFDMDVPAADFDRQPEADRRTALERVHAEATNGFQFIYDRVPIRTAGPRADRTPPLLKAVVDLFNSPGFLELARRLTKDDRIIFADGQATRYLPGHFLNRHSDANEASGRLYAYVLNLTPRWRAEWGGLLQFLDEAGEPAETLVPAFDTLNVFRVPQDHAVSMVTPFAGAPRYSITGWWRSKAPV